MTAMRFSDLSGQKHRRHRAARGSTLLITLLLTATLSLEVIVLSVTLTRGLGEEAVLAQAHVIARQNAELAFTRSAERLRAFLASASPQEADIAFSRGGRKSWQGASLSPDCARRAPVRRHPCAGQRLAGATARIVLPAGLRKPSGENASSDAAMGITALRKTS